MTNKIHLCPSMLTVNFCWYGLVVFFDTVPVAPYSRIKNEDKHTIPNIQT